MSEQTVVIRVRKKARSKFKIKAVKAGKSLIDYMDLVANSEIPK